MTRFHRAVAAGVLALSLASCGDELLSIDGIVGTYTATQLVFQPTGLPAVDVLAGGGSLQITLNADLSTTGTLSVPDSVLGGISASMAGSFDLNDNRVQFSQPADTFVRDLIFDASGSTLVAFHNSIQGQISVTLTRP